MTCHLAHNNLDVPMRRMSLLFVLGGLTNKCQQVEMAHVHAVALA